MCCPPSCECPSHDNATLCKHRLLVLVPPQIPRLSHFLDLSYNRIRSVQHGSFSHLRDLQELDLSHNQLSRMESGAFSGLAKLRILLVHHNQLKLLPPSIFSGMPGLTWLDVRANQLVILLDQTFGGLGELRHLEAGDNPLLFISPSAFLGMPLLQRLGLENTKLGNVPSQALATLRQLSELRLGGVTSVLLRDFSFSHMPSLKVLDLDRWPSLANLGPHSLAGLNLTSLSLTNGNLSSVPAEALSSQVQMRRLDLSDNPIAQLYNGSFARLTRLEELRLSGGRLLSIPSRSFHGLDRLRLLDLSDNPIGWVEESALPPPGVLETLLLSGTALSCDCRLCWLLHHRLRFGGRPPVCSAPDSLKGMVIPDHSRLLCPPLFTCQAPKITERGPRELTAQEGDRLTISCQSRGVPEPSTVWLRPQELWSMGTGSTQDGGQDLDLLQRPYKTQDGRDFDFPQRPYKIQDGRQGQDLDRPQRPYKTQDGHQDLDLQRPYKIQDGHQDLELPRRVDKTQDGGQGLNLPRRPDKAPTWSLSGLTKRRTNATQLLEGRISILPHGSLNFHPVQSQDAGTYLCLATNLAGNDSVWFHLQVTPSNGSAAVPPLPVVHGRLLAIITAGGILPFISSVTLCFIFIFLWSRGRGNIKHTANIEYIPRTSRGSATPDDNKFTMKLI